MQKKNVTNTTKMENDPEKIIKMIENSIDFNLYLEKENDPFKVLIFTILSQRTRDEQTEKIAKKFFKKYPDIESLSNAKVEDVASLIKGVGFYRQKAKRIIEISKEIVEKWGGEVPNNIDDLLKLKGVGRKTANCVLIYAFQKDAIAVDIHVYRISNRIGIVKTKNPKETEIKLMKIFPRKLWKKINPVFIAFGKSICKPTKPLCNECPLSKAKICDYFINIQGQNKK